MSRKLVLASTSKYRGELLGRLGVPFEQAAPSFDERAHDGAWGTVSPGTFATQLARGKAASLQASHPDALILAADQIAVLGIEDGKDGEAPTLLHKPGTPDRAVAQLMRMSGRTHALITGVVLLDAKTGERHETLDEHRMVMRPFEESEARAYVEAYAPVDCAGAYRIEDAGISLFERVEGSDYTGIIGLPLMATARLFRAAGLLAA